MIKVTMRGLQQAQRAMLRAIRAVKPDGALGRAVVFLTAATHRYLVSITHVDTGAYRASQWMQWEGPARMRIFVNPGVRNPRTRALVTSYAPIEEARGGTHEAYKRAVDYAERTLVPRAVAMLAWEVL